MGALLFSLAGCSEAIVVDNEPASLSQVGPVEAYSEPGQAFERPVIKYVLSDSEGDDQHIRIEICDEGGQNCGFPIQGPGSDGTSYLPTDVEGQDTPHQFVWDASCGRLAVGKKALIATKTRTSYIAKITVFGTNETKTTDPFTLFDLNIRTLAPCDKQDLAVQEDSK